MLTDSVDKNPTIASRIGLIAGPVIAVALIGEWSIEAVEWLFTGGPWNQPPPAQLSPARAMAATTALMAVWWMTEALPLWATAIVPIVLFPFMKIMPSREVARQYAHPYIFLFMGGFLIAHAIVRSGLHRRIALLVVGAMGDKPTRLVLGFMVATAVLSMWLSNTATTVMMLPIATSLLVGPRDDPDSNAVRSRFGICLMLGIAYGASIGGIATLIGTPTNVAFSGYWSDQWLPGHPGASEIHFARWMLFALPLSVIFLLIAWAMLVYVIYPIRHSKSLGFSNVGKQLAELGPMSKYEWRVLAVFSLTALLWITRRPADGFGWQVLLGDAGTRMVGDETVAIAMAVLCFLIPRGDKTGDRLLGRDALNHVPWNILLLFGGGFALAKGMSSTGLDHILGNALAQYALAGLPPAGQEAVVAAGMTFLTELTSNTASLQMMLPVLGGAADDLGVQGLQLFLPATIASSCAFMLPVATPPNAIVFGSGYLEIRHMIKAGVCLNVIGVLLVVLWLRVASL